MSGFQILANTHITLDKSHTLTLRIISDRAAVLVLGVGVLVCIQDSWMTVEDRKDVDGYTRKDIKSMPLCLEGVLSSHPLLPLCAV